jgi:hypothetical protein
MKFILMILSCKKYGYKAQRQRQTWLKKIEIPYYHVIGDRNKCVDNNYCFDQENKILYVATPDDYLSLPYKVITALSAIEQEYSPDYILKTDDDQGCDSEFIKNLLVQLEHHRYDYGGYMLEVKDHYSSYYIVHDELPRDLFLKGTRYCNGRFYFLSKKSVEDLLTKLDKIKTHVIEDHTIGLYLDRNLKDNLLSIDTNKYFWDNQ